MPKVLQQTETSTVWTDSGGDKLLDLGTLTTGNSVMGAYLDLGTAPRADWYEVVVVLDGHVSSPTAGRAFEVRFSQSNSTTGFDGNPTTDPTSSAEGAINDLQSRNCKLLGEVRAVSATAGDVLQARFVTKFTGRYIAPIISNVSGTTLKGTADTHSVTLTPIPREIQ